MVREYKIRAPRLVIAGGAVALTMALGIGIAAAADRSGGSSTNSAGTISCPTVADRLPAIPAQAQARASDLMSVSPERTPT